MRSKLIAAACLACVLAPPARPESKLEPPDLEQYVRWGPVRVRPGVTVSDLGYDSNILYASGDEEPVSDITGKISPRLDGLALFGDRAFLTFREQLDFALYLQNGDQNYIDNRSRARLTLPFRNQRVGLFAEMRWNLVNERPIDLEDLRTERKERHFGAGLILRPGWRTEIEVGRAVQNFSYSDPDYADPALSPSARLDRRETATNVEARYRILGRTRLLLDGARRTVDFDRSLLVGEEESSRNQKEWRLVTGLDFGAGGPLSGWFKVGWSKIDADDPALLDLSEPVAEARVSYSFASHTRIRLEGRRSPGLALWGPSPYYINEELGARIVRYLNRTFGLEGAAARGRLTFPSSEASAGREDDISRYDVGLRLRLLRNSLGRTVEYSVRVGRYRRDSTLEGFDLSRNTFTMGVVLGYQD